MFKKVLGVGGLVMAVAAALTLGSGNWALAAQGSQQPQYDCSIKVPEPEPADLASLAKISPEQAMAAAQAAHPGAKITKVKLDNENGCLVYSVKLSNGLDIKVDAGNGKVVHQEQAGAEDYREGKKGEREK